jgi:MarR-like DNA-binding transcriptional regulator SgrR of sgrS sRNA
VSDQREDPLGSHPSTSGRLIISASDGKRISLVPNHRHPDPVSLRQIDIVQMTDPTALRSAFAADEIDIMVVAADEHEIHEGREPATQDGYLVSAPSNSISMLSVRPEGILADPQLRHLLSHWFPREAFQERFLGREGRAAYGFSATTRYAAWSPSDKPPKLLARQVPELEFIVPPSERTVYRAHWLAEEVYRVTGLSLRVTAPSWQEYWAAVSDAGTGDLLWCGLNVEEDQLRDWVLYNLLGEHIPLPTAIEPMRQKVWSGDENILLEVERQILTDGWVIPLYHHHQTYLARHGLKGFSLEASDWPLPGVHHVSELRWA